MSWGNNTTIEYAYKYGIQETYIYMISANISKTCSVFMVDVWRKFDVIDLLYARAQNLRWFGHNFVILDLLPMMLEFVI